VSFVFLFTQGDYVGKTCAIIGSPARLCQNSGVVRAWNLTCFLSSTAVAQKHVSPFNVGDLVSRVRAVLRRCQADAVMRTADLEVNLDTRNVHWGERRTDLTAREYDLLVVLARNAPGVLPRARILDRIWEDRSMMTPMCWTSISDAREGRLIYPESSG
jgi:hypothetical protein